jgi:O-acetyl-ADP-ribose deacetylase (regulator of RNase III)
MGKGVALQFKMAFPDNFQFYQKAVHAGQVKPGTMLVYETRGVDNPKYIINFPTKVHWREKSHYEYIESGLEDLISVIKSLSIHSITLPPLGCGLGRLDWNRVRPMIESAFSQLPEVEVLLFEPSGAPTPSEMPVRTKHPKMTLSRALFIKLVKQYLRLDYRLTLLEVQKIAYFLQESGEKLNLRYEKGYYGPYAPNLNKLLEVMEGHYIRGYGDSQKPDVKIKLIKGAIEEADNYLFIHYLGVNDKLERVAQLIAGFETPYGMELLSSVHWLATHTKPSIENADQAISEMANWSERKKKMFKPHHIKICWERLVAEGWINTN